MPVPPPQPPPPPYTLASRIWTLAAAVSELILAVVLDWSIKDVPASGVAIGRANAIEAQANMRETENFKMIVDVDVRTGKGRVRG